MAGVYVKGHRRGKAVVKAHTRVPAAVRRSNKNYSRGGVSGRKERVMDQLSGKLYRSINKDYKTSYSGRESGRTKLLKRMMSVLHDY
jgi:hypothetical protein